MFNFNMFDQNTYKDLYTANFYIDALQHTKSNLTDKVITDPVLNKAAHNFLDAQTMFAKMIAQNTTAIAKHGVDSFCKTYFPQVSTTTAATTTKPKAL
jgi:hypothetical protein